jgi:hypothetical protein
MKKFLLIYFLTFLLIYSVRFFLDNHFLGLPLSDFFLVDIYDFFVLIFVTYTITYLIYHKIYNKN